MRRLYDALVREHLARFRQMLFLAGPRQVGKTTCSLALKSEMASFLYLNWDIVDHRHLIKGNLQDFETAMSLGELTSSPPLVVFDEIHKNKQWKAFLKGFFDLYGSRAKILVTGSARLNAYRAGGDSLMGRYFLYRMHPLSLGEILDPDLSESTLKIPCEPDPHILNQLYEFGGFPEPYTVQDRTFSSRWRKLRHKQLLQEDLRDLSQIHEVALVEILADLLRHQVGQLTSYSQLGKKVGATINTIKRWLSALESLFYCFAIRPWAKNVTRSLIKEPKYYLYDWSLVEDRGARFENLVASHLLKAVHWWSDRGLGDYDLYFLRDKEKREVDFLVTRDKQPWFLVEAKCRAQRAVSKSLAHFQSQTGAQHAFEVVLEMDYVDADCFTTTQPTIVPAATFFSQLP